MEPLNGVASWPTLKELHVLLRNYVPKQCIRMHIVDMHIHNLPLQLHAISPEEHRLVLAVSSNSSIPVLWVWPLHKHLPPDL